MHPSLVFPPVRERHHSLQNLTKLGNPRTHLCTQTKYNKDSEAPREATGMPGTLRDPQYQVLQARGKLGQPTGKAAPAFTRAVMILAIIPFSLTSHKEWQHNHLDSSRLFLTQGISIRKRKRNILVS